MEAYSIRNDWSVVEEIERGLYDFGQPSKGHALDICLCSDTYQRCNLQHAFGRDKRWFSLLSYCSLPQRTGKKSVGCSPTSVLQLRSIRTLLDLYYTCTAPGALLGNVASTKTTCCTCNNCSVSRSSSLVGGRLTSSLLP